MSMVKPRHEFLDLLNVASQNAQLVAEVLASQGYHIRILPHSVAPSVEERWKHTDDGDLEITQRIELKHWPNLDFQSLAEVPYDNVIVDEAYKIEQTHRTSLYAYLILNKSLTGFLLIPVWSRPHWFKRELPDGREHSMKTYYMCAKSFLSFHLLREERNCLRCEEDDEEELTW